MEFSSDVLTLEVDQHVATLWLDRAEARNAMGSALWRDLPRAAAAVEAERDVRVLVIAAKGPHFSVGLDLKEFGGGFAAGALDVVPGDLERAVLQGRARDAGVGDLDRRAVGAGDRGRSTATASAAASTSSAPVTCACAPTTPRSRCERPRSRSSRTSVRCNASRRSSAPATWPNWPTPARTSTRSARCAIGLVNAVYGNSDEVLAGAHALAREIAQNSPLAVQGTKAVLAANDGRSVDEGLEFVARWNTMYLQSNDLREAMMAFMEKRPPVFSGD